MSREMSENGIAQKQFEEGLFMDLEPATDIDVDSEMRADLE